jgi:hypothetical protein
MLPKGPKWQPNLGRSEYGAHTAQVTVAVFSALTLLFVSMRVYGPLTGKGNWEPDDCEREAFFRDSFLLL